MARPPKAKAATKGARMRKPRKTELMVYEGEPPLPDGMNSHAQKKWYELIAIMAETGMLNKNDAGLYEQYCIQWEVLKRAQEQLKKHGLVQTLLTKRGKIFRTNPAVAMITQANRQLQTLGQELGLSPTGRARLGIADAIRAIDNPAFKHLK